MADKEDQNQSDADRDLEGQVAIVTGAAVGIGLEFARGLAARGASIVLNDIDESAAVVATAELLDGGSACECVVGDSSDLNVIDQLVDKAVTRFGRLDIAIANAGISPFGSFLDYDLDRFRRLNAVNLEGTFFLAQCATKQFLKQQTEQTKSSGGSGRILLMSSVTGFQYHPDCTAYAMTKAAIRMLVKSLAIEFANKGIRVNGIAPGATAVDRTLEDETYDATWSRITPTGRTATPADIAHAAMFLLSSAAEHITGQTLVVDGGWTSVSPPPY